jgi:hypothetical protein
VAGLCEVDHSIPSSVKVNNTYSPIWLHGVRTNNFNIFTSAGLKCKDRTKTMLPLHSNGNADPGGREV